MTIDYNDFDRARLASNELQLKNIDAELLPYLRRGDRVFHRLRVQPEYVMAALAQLRIAELLGDIVVGRV